MKKLCLKQIGSLALALTVISGLTGAISWTQVSAASAISQLQVSDSENAADWSVQSDLQEGDLQFGDRDVTFETVPGFLIGVDYIRTAADSKAYDGDLGTFTANADIFVYIALDDRVDSSPAWLSEWMDTGEDIVNSNDVVFSLYQASFEKGDVITLGENGQSSGCVNYTVMVVAKDIAVIRGDVNADGQFAAVDVTMMQKWLLNAGSMTDWTAGDLCVDGKIDVFDLCLMKRELINASGDPTEPTERAFRFSVADGLFDQDNTDTLSLSYPEGLETVTVWKADEDSDHYCNGVCLAGYDGKLYCQWQSSAKDEDSEDTHVMYAVSSDQGRTWSEPQLLIQDIGDGYCSSGGWLATDDQLVAYINYWPADLSPRGGFAYYMTSQDGVTWTDPQPVMMADGTPMNAVFEQDPHVLESGRVVNAAHFQEGLIVSPIYTDDPSGITGWKKGDFTPNISGSASVEMEPSLFVQSDGTIVMIFRDQQSSYKKIVSYSRDEGVTWSSPQITEMPDARTKQSAGNLSDGTAFMAGSPVSNSLRSPLAVVLSADGQTFDQAYLLRSNSSDPELIYEGKAKRKGFHYVKSLVCDGYLYVGYATNKEAVEISIIPEESIMLN
ncbi:MAG: exo-alpha-sialidase [Ruminococcus sp.]|nr:exo-alpha-sialidase [Ruminococcus sp.]